MLSRVIPWILADGPVGNRKRAKDVLPLALDAWNCMKYVMNPLGGRCVVVRP